jgi:hypothetical protein
MSSSNLIRWGGLAAMLAGVAFVTADLLSLSIYPKFPAVESLTSGVYAVQSVLKLLAAVLLLVGLFGLYIRQAEAAGILGLAGFLIALTGTVLMIGAFWATAFFAPFVAAGDPAWFDAGEGPTGRLAVAFAVSDAFFVLGWSLFGIATLKARIYPRVAAVLLVVGAVPVLGTLLVVGFPTSIMFSAAVAWLGYALWSEKSVPARQLARVS